MKPKIIIFEGIDYSGKTTMIEYMSELMGEDSISHVCTKGLGGGEVGALFRKKIIDQTTNKADSALIKLGMLYSNLETFLDVIKPNYNDGKVVLCDRLFPSFVAYGDATNYKTYDMFYKDIFTSGKYDFEVIYCHIPASVSISRRLLREPTSFFDMNSVAELNKINNRYNEYFISIYNKMPVHILDCNHPIDVVKAELKKIYEKIKQ